MKHFCTVAIAHRNNGSYLRQAVESVAAQVLATDRRLRVLVIDDCSEEESSRVVFSALEAEYDKDARFVFVRHAVRSGMAGVRNHAARLAAEEAGDSSFASLFFVDADDYVRPQYVENLAAIMAANPDMDFVVPAQYTKYYDLERGGRRSGQTEWVDMNRRELRGVGSIAAYNLQFIQEMGGWDLGFDLAGGDEGTSFFYRAEKLGARWVVMPTSLDAHYVYRQWHKPPTENRRAIRMASDPWCASRVGTRDLPLIAQPTLATNLVQAHQWPTFWAEGHEMVPAPGALSVSDS